MYVGSVIAQMHFNNWSIDQKVCQAWPGGSSAARLGLARLGPARYVTLARAREPKVGATRYSALLLLMFSFLFSFFLLWKCSLDEDGGDDYVPPPQPSSREQKRKTLEDEA